MKDHRCHFFTATGRAAGLVAALILLCFPLFAGAQGTAFAYQGQLNFAGLPANGTYDLAFGIYDAETNGTQLGLTLTNSTLLVTNGGFAVTLDFGPVFDGHPAWLQVAVRTNGAADFIALNPRQRVTPVPYAIMAGSASNLVGSLPAAQLSGALPLASLPAAVVTNGATGLNLAGTFTGSGAGLNGIFATNLTADTSIRSLTIRTTAPAPGANWAFYAMSRNSSNFLTLGGPVDSGANGPGLYFDPLAMQTGANGQVGVEVANAMSETFATDGSEFIVGLLGQGRTFDLLVNNVDTLITNTLPSDGNPYWMDVTFATAATRTITLRNAYGFLGVYLPVTNGFFVPKPPSSRMVVLGDSFAEQGYLPGAPCLGIVSQIQSLLPQFDIWALGQGGTGYVNPGPLARTNFLGRANDVINAAPQYVLIYGGINDTGLTTNTLPTNPVYVNATNLLFTLKAALPAAEIAVIGPQWPGTPSPVGNANVFDCAILLSNACSICDVPYVNPLTQPWVTGNASIPNSGNADVYTLPTDGTHPTIPAGAKYLANQIVSSLSTIWNLSNPASESTPVFSPIVSQIVTPIPAGGVFWNSNGILYWATSTRTNYLAGP